MRLRVLYDAAKAQGWDRDDLDSWLDEMFSKPPTRLTIEQGEEAIEALTRLLNTSEMEAGEQEAAAQPAVPTPTPSALCTPAQLKLIYLTATRDLNITEEQLEERCQAQYGRMPLHLTKREASEFIEALKAGAATGGA